MNFIARVFRFLFWLLVVSWSVALLKKLVAGWCGARRRVGRVGKPTTSRRFRRIAAARSAFRGDWYVIRFAERTWPKFWRSRCAKMGTGSFLLGSVPRSVSADELGERT